jgi:hypothetical protein
MLQQRTAPTTRRRLPSPRGTCAGSAAPPDPGRDGAWTYTETVDDAAAVVEVRGRVDRLTVDLLRGTVEQLHRRGRARITIALRGAVTIDPAARAVLDEMALDLARCGTELVVAELPAPDGEPADRISPAR